MSNLTLLYVELNEYHTAIESMQTEYSIAGKLTRFDKAIKRATNSAENTDPFS